MGLGATSAPKIGSHTPPEIAIAIAIAIAIVAEITAVRNGAPIAQRLANYTLL